jgi:hypothetical protein
MKKKWWIIGFATLAIAGGRAIAIPMLQPPQPGVTKANFDRIEKGMSYAQVDAILGERSLLQMVQGSFTSSLMYHQHSWWNDDGACAHIVFSLDDEVTDKTWHPSTETITDKLRRWLSLP